jgi:hemoglobin-like flavoprotein
MMTPHDIALVRESFAHLHRRKAETAQIFYDRLFAIAPEARALFKGDMAAQGLKLMEMLTVAMATLNDRDGLTVLLKRLGQRHKAYGVAEGHYANVGEALLWTLRTSLGQAHTPEIARAWSGLYDHIAEVMISASRDV